MQNHEWLVVLLLPGQRSWPMRDNRHVSNAQALRPVGSLPDAVLLLGDSKRLSTECIGQVDIITPPVDWIPY